MGQEESLIGTDASGEEVGQTTGEIEYRERLGGLLRYYRRAA